jgi:hypothetical protein
LIGILRVEPTLLTLSGTYPEVCAFVGGYDEAIGRIVAFPGFQSWLAGRFGIAHNIAYWHSIAEMAVPGLTYERARRLTAEEDRRATHLLTDLMAKYLAENPIAVNTAVMADTQRATDFAISLRGYPTSFTWFGTYPEVVAHLSGYGFGSDNGLMIDGFVSWLSGAGIDDIWLPAARGAITSGTYRMPRSAEEDSERSVRLLDGFVSYLRSVQSHDAR